MRIVGAAGVRLAVVRAVVLHRLDDRRVGRLRREARDVEVLVGLDATVAQLAERSRTTSHAPLRVAAEDVDAVQLVRRTSGCSSAAADVGVEGLRVLGPSVAQITCGGAIGNDWSEHCWTSAVVTNGMSGRPVTAPVESLQLRMLSTDGQRTPTRCRPWRRRSGTPGSRRWWSRWVQLRVVEVDHDLAAGEAAAAGLAVQVLGHAFDRVLRALEQVRARSGCRRRR